MGILRGFGVGLALFGLLLLAGCGKSGPKVVPVSGQVLIDGKPLAAGVPGFIMVIPEGSRAATGNIDPKTGRFSLTTTKPNDGCVPGTHKVTVHVSEMVGPDNVSLIPEHYSDPATSGLTVTIDGPTDNLEVKLTGPLRPSQGAPKDSIYSDPNKY